MNPEMLSRLGQVARYPGMYLTHSTFPEFVAVLTGLSFAEELALENEGEAGRTLTDLQRFMSWLRRKYPGWDEHTIPTFVIRTTFPGKDFADLVTLTQEEHKVLMSRTVALLCEHAESQKDSN